MSLKSVGIPCLCHFHRGKEPFSQRRGVKLGAAAPTATVQPKRQWQRRREKRRERTSASGLASLILRRTVRPLGVVATAPALSRFSAPPQHRAMVSRPVRPIFVRCAGFAQAAFPPREGSISTPCRTGFGVFIRDCRSGICRRDAWRRLESWGQMFGCSSNRAAAICFR